MQHGNEHVFLLLKCFLGIKFPGENFYQFRGSGQAPGITVGVAIVFQERAAAGVGTSGAVLRSPRQDVLTCAVSCAPVAVGGQCGFYLYLLDDGVELFFSDVICLSPESL